MSDQFKGKNIEVVKNSNKEIRDVLWEAHARSTNIWPISDKDEVNQDLFRGYFSNETKKNTIRARIGSEFLKSVI